MATCILPSCFGPGRQLHHAFRPGSAQLPRQWGRCLPHKTLPSAQTLRSADTVVKAAASDDAIADQAAIVRAASVNATRVKAAFADAGLSPDAIDYVLTKYPHYLRWQVEEKLLPAIQRKQQEIGANFPSELERVPKLLLRSTEITAAAASAGKAAKVRAATVNAARVKAAFAEAGLSQAAINHILTQYPPYLRWPVEQKLLSAMQRWQQELGTSFVPEFERIPSLLHKKPEKELLKSQYLASIGIRSPESLRKSSPAIFTLSLASMQGKVAFLQALGFTHGQVSSLVERHTGILFTSSERVEELLRVISVMFGCAQDMDSLASIVLSCRVRGLFSHFADVVQSSFSYYCTCVVVVNDKEKERAWRHAVFRVPPAELDIRLDSIATQLGATLDQAKSMVRKQPQIAPLQPARVRLHVTQMLGLGFSHSQVKSMCLRQPSLLASSYSSRVQVEKWVFLTGVLQLSLDAIAAKPHLLMYSLPNRLGPRWEYLQQLRSHGVIAFTGVHDVISSLADSTDTQFRARYTAPVMRVYDEHFQQQWQQRWDFLLDGQQLSVQDIADHPLVLQASLKDTVGPRWAYLLLLTSSLDSFRPVDHLTALSTMSDAEFASAYSGMSQDVAFDVAFVEDWQQANMCI